VEIIGLRIGGEMGAVAWCTVVEAQDTIKEIPHVLFPNSKRMKPPMPQPVAPLTMNPHVMYKSVNRCTSVRHEYSLAGRS